MTVKNYDVICIGAGSGGLNIAGFMNKAGFKVLLIDKSDPHIGGDCLNFGCVPSKAVIHAARLVKGAKESEQYGVKTSGQVDLKKVMDYVRAKQDIIREHENATYFRKLGMDVELGEAKFVSKNSIMINGKEYSAKKIVLATGSRPRMIPIKGIDKVKYITNENIFNLEKLPKKFVVIGAGPIGMEMSQAFRRLGSEVIVLERGDKFLPKETKESADVLYEQLVKEGIQFYFESEIVEFSGSKEIVFKNKAGKKITYQFDEVLISVGRQLNHEGLDLEKAGVELDESGHRLKVDEYLRTTNKDVLVCGDIAGSFQFTHAAELHAGVIINNFFSPKKKKLNNDHISWVTYTSPEIATFGLSEVQLQERGITYEKIVQDFKEDDRAIVDDYTGGKLVLFISKNKILGGSMVAMSAGELSQELSLAMSAGTHIKHIFGKVYPYPTATRINKRAISTHFAKKLTPGVKKFFKFMYGKV